MQKQLKIKEIDALVRPFTPKEAYKYIGKYIMKRPGVYHDDDGSVYQIVGVTEKGFVFWEKDYLWNPYKFDNIIYDYVFENGELMGAKKCPE